MRWYLEVGPFEGDQVMRVGALRNGISALMKEPSEPPSHSATSGHVHTVCEPGHGLSPDTESAGTLILDLSAFRIARNKCLRFISHPVDGNLLKHPDPG